VYYAISHTVTVPSAYFRNWAANATCMCGMRERMLKVVTVCLLFVGLC